MFLPVDHRLTPVDPRISTASVHVRVGLHCQTTSISTLPHSTDRRSPAGFSERKNEKEVQIIRRERVSKVQRHHQHVIGHFGDESFQSITCTGTDNLTRTTRRQNSQITK